MRVSLRARLILSLAVSLAGCAAPPPPAVKTPPPATPDLGPPSSGRIVFDCEPTSARVTIDGEPRGTVAEIAAAGGLSLPGGLHRIEISAYQYGTFRLELNLGAKTERIQVKLIRTDTKP